MTRRPALLAAYDDPATWQKIVGPAMDEWTRGHERPRGADPEMPPRGDRSSVDLATDVSRLSRVVFTMLLSALFGVFGPIPPELLDAVERHQVKFLSSLLW